MSWKSVRIVAMSSALAVGVIGCQPTTRLGMVKDPGTGLMIGSVVSNNLITDSAFFRNKRIKVRVRNTSGDTAFDLYSFDQRLRSSYASKGYDPSSDDDFGLLVDLNVLYSGHIQQNLAAQFGFLGAAGGGIAGYRSNAPAGTAVGILAGATLGSVIGSFITDDTYIIVAEATFVITTKNTKRAGKTVTFSRSYRSEDRDEDDSVNRIRKSERVRVAVFAGGRNTPQSAISGMVRDRIVRIVGDFI